MGAIPKKADQIFVVLRDRIVYLDYLPGTLLSEKELCEEFKVSRTPLREAIRRLEDMGLVKSIPRFGTHVTAIDINEIRCAFEVKKKLEALAGALAARRISKDRLEELRKITEEVEGHPEGAENRKLIELDARFHEVIYEATQNSILKEFLENLHSRCARLWASNLSVVIPPEEVVAQLRKIYNALKQGDEEMAAKVLEDHVNFFIDRLKEQLL